MKKIYLLFVLSVSCSFSFAQWQSVGGSVSSGFSRYQSLAFNPSTYEPYLAFMDGSNAPASVKKFNGTSWVYVGPAQFTGVFSGYISLDFNPISSEPYMVFSDNGNSNKATVKKFDGSNWVNVGVAGFSPSGTSFNTIRFNPVNNSPYVAFVGAGSKCTVMMFNGTSWVTVGNAGFSAGQINGQIGLAFHPITGDPYVLYTDMANGQVATCMKFDGSNWNGVGPAGFSPGLASNVSLAFNPITNEPYAAFSDVSNNGASVMRYDGINWVVVGNYGFSPGIVSGSQIGFQPATNLLYIAFRDWSNNYATTVMDFNGSAWNIVGAAVDVGVNDYPNLAFHPLTHEPYVGYQSNNSSNNVGRVKKFQGCFIDTSIIQNNDTLIANQTGASYQWIDCSTNNPIPGETGQNYIASSNGDYAVIITMGICSDTSGCANVLITDDNHEDDYNKVTIYPNPTDDYITIDIGNLNRPLNYSIVTVDGRIMEEKNDIKPEMIKFDLRDYSNGIYFLKVNHTNAVHFYKIIKR